MSAVEEARLCPVTGRVLRSGFVHEAAWDGVLPFLRELGGFMEALQAAVGGQLRLGVQSGGRRVAGPGVPLVLGKLEPAWVVRNDVLSWTSRAADWLGAFTPVTWGTVGGFWRVYYRQLCFWPEAMEAIDCLADAYRICVRVIDHPLDKSFIGLCLQCGKPLYLPWHRRCALVCPRCGCEMELADARRKAIESIAYLWLPLDDALLAAGMITGRALPKRKTVQKWGERGLIEVRNYLGKKLYQPKQLGDVMTRHAD